MLGCEHRFRAASLHPGMWQMGIFALMVHEIIGPTPYVLNEALGLPLPY